MFNKKFIIITNVVLPIVVIATTITLFFMFQPIETPSLFYINLGYIVFLEAIFFGYLNILYGKKNGLSMPFFAIFGVYCLYYIILGVVWMLVYSLVLNNFTDTHKLYIAVLMSLTLLWIIISIITARTASNYNEKIETLIESGQSMNFYMQKITFYASQYEKLCIEKGLKYSTNSSNRTELDRLKGKINFITPNVLKNETVAVQLGALLSKCEYMIEEMELASNEYAEIIQKKMQRFVDNAVAEIDMFKNLARR